MYRKYVYQGVTWYDFREIQKTEAVEVCTLYGLGANVIKLILNTSVTHTVSDFHNCLVASMTIPYTVNTDKEKKVQNKPIHFVVGESFLITVRFDEVCAIEDTKESLDLGSQDSLLSTDILAHILIKIYKHIYQDLSSHLDDFSSQQCAYAYQKYLVRYRRILASQEKFINALQTKALDFFSDPTLETIFLKITKNYRHILTTIDQQHARISYLMPRTAPRTTGMRYLRYILHFFFVKR